MGAELFGNYLATTEWGQALGDDVIGDFMGHEKYAFRKGNGLKLFDTREEAEAFARSVGLGGNPEEINKMQEKIAKTKEELSEDNLDPKRKKELESMLEKDEKALKHAKGDYDIGKATKEEMKRVGQNFSQDVLIDGTSFTGTDLTGQILGVGGAGAVTSGVALMGGAGLTAAAGAALPVMASALLATGGYYAGEYLGDKISGTEGQIARYGATMAGGAAAGAVIGTFIPIPGVGTAVGAAIGAAVAGIGLAIADAYDYFTSASPEELIQRKEELIAEARAEAEKMREDLTNFQGAQMKASGATGANAMGLSPNGVLTAKETGLPENFKAIAMQEAFQERFSQAFAQFNAKYREAQAMDAAIMEDRTLRQEQEDNWSLFSDDVKDKYHNNTADTVQTIFDDVLSLFDPNTVYDLGRINELAEAGITDQAEVQKAIRSNTYKKITEDGKLIDVDWSSEEGQKALEDRRLRAGKYLAGLRNLARIESAEGGKGMFEFDAAKGMSIEDIQSAGEMTNEEVFDKMMNPSASRAKDAVNALTNLRGEAEGVDDDKDLTKILTEKEKEKVEKLLKDIESTGGRQKAYVSKEEKELLKKAGIDSNLYQEPQGEGTRSSLMLQDGQRVTDFEDWKKIMEHGYASDYGITDWPYGVANELGVPMNDISGKPYSRDELEEKLRDVHKGYIDTGFLPKKTTLVDNIANLAVSGDIQGLAETSGSSVDQIGIESINAKRAKGWTFNTLERKGPDGKMKSVVVGNHPDYGQVSLGDLKDRNQVAALMQKFQNELYKDYEGRDISKESIQKQKEIRASYEKELKEEIAKPEEERDLDKIQRLQKSLSESGVQSLFKTVDSTDGRKTLAGQIKSESDIRKIKHIPDSQKAVLSALASISRSAQRISPESTVPELDAQGNIVEKELTPMEQIKSDISVQERLLQNAKSEEEKSKIQNKISELKEQEEKGIESKGEFDQRLEKRKKIPKTLG